MEKTTDNTPKIQEKKSPIKHIVNFFSSKIKQRKEAKEELRKIEEEQRRKQEFIQFTANNFFSADFMTTINETAGMDKSSLIAIVEKSVDVALDDNYLSQDEEKRISNFMDHYGISSEQIRSSYLNKIVQGAIIRDLFDGNVNPRISVSNAPFNFMKKEVLIWCGNAFISEIKTVKEWVGGTSGFSFRVAKGVYWRVGGIKGHRIEKQINKELGDGVIAITNYHVYMKTGQIDSMRIKLDKIISVEADAENVIIFRDGARSNPICFSTPDAWFIANVIQNASNWQ